MKETEYKQLADGRRAKLIKDAVTKDEHGKELTYDHLIVENFRVRPPDLRVVGIITENGKRVFRYLKPQIRMEEVNGFPYPVPGMVLTDVPQEKTSDYMGIYEQMVRELR